MSRKLCECLLSKNSFMFLLITDSRPSGVDNKLVEPPPPPPPQAYLLALAGFKKSIRPASFSFRSYSAGSSSGAFSGVRGALRRPGEVSESPTTPTPLILLLGGLRALHGDGGHFIPLLSGVSGEIVDSSPNGSVVRPDDCCCSGGADGVAQTLPGGGVVGGAPDASLRWDDIVGLR